MLLRSNVSLCLYTSALVALGRTGTCLRTLLCFVAFGVMLLLGSNRIIAQTRLQSVDTCFASVGDTAHIACTLFVSSSSAAERTLEGTLQLTNATVFFPLRFQSLGADTSKFHSSLQRVSATKYSFRIRLISSDSVVKFVLVGEALAGNDSLCSLSFSSLSLDTLAIPNLRTTVLSRSIGTPLPYIRFASLSEAVPNPCEGCSFLRWTYSIDKASPLVFTFRDALGRALRIYQLDAPSGDGQIELIPDVNFSAGVYSMHLSTNSGDAVRLFVIVN